MNIIEWLKKRGIKVKNEALVKQAFMHSSYAHENYGKQDNERLEFMGDAVLQLWSSEHLFPLDPPLNEGQMTTLRAKLVCEKALAIYAKELHLNDFLLLGSGEEKTGGRERDSIVSDMFEAFLGALYLDQGMEAINNILDEVILPRLDKPFEIHTIDDYKTKLQEYVQSDTRKTVRYEVIKSSGPSNQPTFEVQVVMDDIVLGKGKGTSKKKAEQAAAKDAFEKLVR